MAEDFKETSWDHLSGEKTASISTSEKKWIKVIQDLKEKYPEQVDIVAVEQDGSLLAHIPVDWLRIRPKKKTNMTEDQREAAAARLKLARQKKLDSKGQADAAVT